MAVVLVLTLAVGLGAVLSCSGAATGEVREVRLGPRVVEIAPDRGEPAVAELWMQVRCVRRATAAEEAAGGLAYATCDGFTFDGEPLDYGTLLKLEPVGRNRFRLEGHVARFRDDRGGHLCIALRAVFAGVLHEHDAGLYADPDDRYSLLSYCTVAEQPAWAPGRHPFDQNRAAGLEDFNARLEAPIQLRLRPLGAQPRQPRPREGGSPPS